VDLSLTPRFDWAAIINVLNTGTGRLVLNGCGVSLQDLQNIGRALCTARYHAKEDGGTGAFHCFPLTSLDLSYNIIFCEYFREAYPKRGLWAADLLKSGAPGTRQRLHMLLTEAVYAPPAPNVGDDMSSLNPDIPGWPLLLDKLSVCGTHAWDCFLYEIALFERLEHLQMTDCVIGPLHASVMVAGLVRMLRHRRDKGLQRLESLEIRGFRVLKPDHAAFLEKELHAPDQDPRDAIVAKLIL
jgi:hypothetical protein